MDKTKYQYEGLKWLMELEMLNHPQAINTIKLNVLMVSKSIKEVELLIYREDKSMLVLLELSWTGKKFFKRRIFSEVHDILSQLLPTFRFRVTDDPKIMEMAVERVKQALTGGKYETTSNSGDSIDKPENTTPDDPYVIAAAAFAAVQSSTETNQTQQSESIGNVPEPTSSNDSSEK